MDLKHIGYIEDDLDIQVIAGIALEDIGGYCVTMYDNGAKALAGLPFAPPDLIILDVMMPEMDGPQTLEEIRKIDALKHIPVVFCTAKVQNAETDYFKALGAVDVIVKPFDPMTLSQTIQSIWERTLPHSE